MDRSPRRLMVERLDDRLTPATLPDGFSERLIASDLTLPSAMELVPDGRILVAEGTGALRIIRDGHLLPDPVLELDVIHLNERGLLGVTIDPNFIENPYIYVYYTARGSGGNPDFNRVSRFLLDGDQIASSGEEVLINLELLESDTRHNGGALHFGPDGKLYIATGDGTIPSNSQSLATTKGKILRLNPDGSIPEDNPFTDQTSGANQAIWALGLRNPFSFAFQPGTGRMFINDVGEARFEETNPGRAGANYGWPVAEGPSGDPLFVDPVLAVPHDRSAGLGFAIAGVDFYNPSTTEFPATYFGDYFFANFVLGRIRHFDPGSGQVELFADGLKAPVDIDVSDDGALYYLERGNGVTTGSVYRVDWTESLIPEVTVPPTGQLVSVGQEAVFSVSASGSQPLAYQWLRDGVPIPGATSPEYLVPSAALTDSGARFSVMVRNAFGSVISPEAVLEVTTDRPPVVTIDTPSVGSTFSAGTTLMFRGSAVDPETGPLPASALTWQIEYVTAGAVRQEMEPITGVESGTFDISARTPFLGTDVLYRLRLTAQDPLGLKHTEVRELSPEIGTFTVTSNLPVVLRVDGAEVPSSSTFKGVTGV